MKISIITLFPEMFVGPFDHSILKRAKEQQLVKIHIINLRTFGFGRHKSVDDKPFGGGTGMVIRVDVLDQAIEAVRDTSLTKTEEHCILLDARGAPFNQMKATYFSTIKHLIIVCGHYEGVDERVRSLVDNVISIGDFILTGGEIPAMMITDSISRLIPGVLKQDATTHESFSYQEKTGLPLLEYPQYTLPREYKGMRVPEILFSGNHQEIDNWKKQQAHLITRKYRPDLLKK
jgi:tRNA (guanine37-N1)-methyltransferase